VIRQREFIARSRHRLVLLAVLGAISFALATEHSGLGHGSPIEEGMADAVSMCLATFVAGASVLLGASALLLPRRFPLAAREVGSESGVLVPSSPPLSRPARAGPSLLQVFRL
jgi:hypothetical protein